MLVPGVKTERPESRREARRRNRRGALAAWAAVGSLLGVLLLGAAGSVVVFATALRPSPPVAAVAPASLAPAPEAPEAPPPPPEPEPPPEPPAFDAGALQDRLEELAGRHPGTFGVAVLEPQSGEGVFINADERFYAASIAKLPPLIALYRAADAGEIDLDEPISMLPTDVQAYGTGVLYRYPVGHTLTLRQCAEYLMKESDNTAWVMLERRLSFDEISAETRAIGADDTSYYPHYTSTPRDVLLMLEKVADPRFTSEKLSDEMLATMTDTAFEDRLPAKLPEEVRVAHKIGTYGSNIGDAGVVFYKDRAGKERHYFVVVMAEGTTEYAARQAIQEMSLATYRAIAERR